MEYVQMANTFLTHFVLLQVSLEMETKYPLHNLTEKLDTVEPLHNGYFGDRRKWPLWRGGRHGEVGV